MLRPSETDAAASRFESFCSVVTSLPRAAAWSESDTRAKLIDPLLTQVLGWSEREIRREEPVAKGFVDYTLGIDFRYLHIEAKREAPRFVINSPSRDRLLKVSGPHLLGNRDMKPLVEQAAKYSFELGTEYSLLTNGHQFVLFRTRVPGRSWRDYSALVWHDLDDIINDFADFFHTLSQESVTSGRLLERFETANSATQQLYRPMDRVTNAHSDLIRNRFWSHVSSLVGPLLIDEPDDEALQEEIIRHCYVRTPISDSVDTTIQTLLRDDLSPWMKNARIARVVPSSGPGDALGHALNDDIKSRRGVTYIVTGGVGSGKTTFLRRHSKIVNRSFVESWCIWLHVDFLKIGNVDESEVQQEVSRYFYSRVRSEINDKHPALVPKDGLGIRKIFAKQLAEAELTQLFGLEHGTDERQRIENQIVERLYSSDELYVHALLETNRLGGRRIVIVLDNTDQLGEVFQAAMFLFAQKLCRDFGALTMVALREEKFFAAFRRGVFDAFGDKRFHIGSPDLKEVIRQRLEYGLRKYNESGRPTDMSQSDHEDVVRVMKALIQSTTQKNQNIVRYLACVSNGDMRHALGVFREFIQSGNTDIDKILRVVAESGSYTVPFHEFAKSAILGSKKFYHSNASHVLNVFQRTSASSASHFTVIRILARLSSIAGAPSSHGPGFLASEQLMREYRQSFGRADDLMHAAKELMSRGLLESEPPRADALERADAVRISASGEYYWRYLVRAFAYIDLVYLDTPIASRDVAENLAAVANTTDLSVRFERVRKFLDYLEQQEDSEVAQAALRQGAFSGRLIPVVREQIEDEISEIIRRTGAIDLSQDWSY